MTSYKFVSQKYQELDVKRFYSVMADSNWADSDIHSEVILPDEILSTIFNIFVKRNGCVPGLCRLAQVCSQWRRVAMDISFWKTVDLSSGWINKTPQGLDILCMNYLGPFTEKISMEAWFQLEDSGLIKLSQSCPRTECLDLSNCEKLSGDALSVIAENFTNIKSLRFSNTSPIAVSNRSLRAFLDIRGRQLIHLDLSGNETAKDFHKIISIISERCCKLEGLVLHGIELSGLFSLEINVSRLARDCPKLRLLDLGQTRAHMVDTVVRLQEPLRFDFLKTFVAPLSRDDHPWTITSHILATAPCLERLDLSNCQAMHLLQISSNCLKELKFCTSTAEPLEILKQNTFKRLQVLDLSGSTALGRQEIDASLASLFSTNRLPELQELILCSTRVSWIGIRAVISNCGTLRRVNCVCCVNVPRFWARDIRGNLRDRLYQLFMSGVESRDAEEETLI